MITGKRQDPQTNAFFSNRGDYLSHKTKTIVIWRPRASMKWVRPLQKKVFFMRSETFLLSIKVAELLELV